MLFIMAEKKKRKMNPNSLKNLEKGRGFSKNNTEIARKAQAASVEARKENATYRTMALMVDSLPVSEDVGKALDDMGIPKDFHVRGLRKVLKTSSKAEEGDMKAMELWLKMRGDLDEKTNVNVNVNSGSVITLGDKVFEE